MGGERGSSEGSGRQSQRQRVTTRESLDPRGLGRRDPFGRQQRGRPRGWQVPDGDDLEESAEPGRPVRDRRLAAGHHEARPVAERGHDDPAQPRIDRPQRVVLVEDDHHEGTQRAETVGQALHARELATGGHRQRGKEAALRRLDGGPVERDDGGTGGGCRRFEGAEDGGLADATQPMDVGHERAVRIEHASESCRLPLAPDQRAGALIDAVLDRRLHAVSMRATST